MATTMASPMVSPTDLTSAMPNGTALVALPANEREAAQEQQRLGQQHQQHQQYAQRGGIHSPSHYPLRKSFRSFSNISTIIVGNQENKRRQETKYIVHKELLTSVSPFFAGALNGNFAEGKEQVVRLPEEKPDTFEWFLQWLYTGTLKTPPSKFCHIEPGDPATAICPVRSTLAAEVPADPDLHLDGDLRNGEGNPKYFLLFNLYALSDRLLTTSLSNHIINTMVRLSDATNSVPTPSDTEMLYEDIRDTSPMRRLVLDLFSHKQTGRLIESHPDEWHPLFTRDLCAQQLHRVSYDDADAWHRFHDWWPVNWPATRPCKACHTPVAPAQAPGLAPNRKCATCDLLFCADCLSVRKGAMLGTPAGGPPNECKPWSGRGLCARYHEHDEGQGCA